MTNRTTGFSKGTVLDFYIKYPFFDKLNHGLAGVLFTGVGLITFYWINPDQRIRLTVRPGFVAFFCISFSTMGKVLWEYYEFAGDRILNANMQRWQFGAVYALTDTMLDLAIGMAGSLVVSLFVRHKPLQDMKLFYRRYIGGFFQNKP